MRAKEPLLHRGEISCGSLPEHWRLVRLQDLAQVTVGYVGPTNPYYTVPERGILFLRTGNITENGIEIRDVRWVTEAFHAAQLKSALHSGDVVVSRVGYTGTAAVVPDLGLVNCANMIIIRPTGGMDSGWIRRLFGAEIYLAQVRGLTAGSAQPVLNIKLVQRLVTPLPPLAEQRYINSILNTIDETIRKNEQLIAKLKQVKQGLLHDLVTRGLDDNGEIRDPERHPEQFKESPLGRIPRHWQVGPAARWCARLTVGVVNSATHAYAANGVPFIRSQNVRPNFIDRSDMLFITERFNRQQSKSVVRVGDVVIVRTGYPGTAAVVPPSLDGANCFSLVIASPVADLNSNFLAQYLNSPICMAEIARTHFGSAQHNFNVGEMRRLPLSIPPPAEQQAILQVLNVHEERSSAEDNEVLKLRLLKQGLMEDLLIGRVRVTNLLTEAAA